MVLLDTTILGHLLLPETKAPIDPATAKPVNFCKERIEFFIKNHQRTRIVVAMPSVAELLVKADDQAEELLARLNKSSAFKLASFDQAAAVECAAMEREARAAGDKRGGSTDVWAKVKVDRQILAIGRVAGVVDFYSDDDALRNMASRLGINAKTIADMPIPPDAKQIGITFPDV